MDLTYGTGTMAEGAPGRKSTMSRRCRATDLAGGAGGGAAYLWSAMAASRSASAFSSQSRASAAALSQVGC